MGSDIRFYYIAQMNCLEFIIGESKLPMALNHESLQHPFYQKGLGLFGESQYTWENAFLRMKTNWNFTGELFFTILFQEFFLSHGVFLFPGFIPAR